MRGFFCNLWPVKKLLLLLPVSFCMVACKDYVPVNGNIYDAITLEPLDSVWYYSVNGTPYDGQELLTSESGHFSGVSHKKESYLEMRFSREGYLPQSIIFEEENVGDGRKVYLEPQ